MRDVTPRERFKFRLDSSPGMQMLWVQPVQGSHMGFEVHPEELLQLKRQLDDFFGDEIEETVKEQGEESEPSFAGELTHLLNRFCAEDVSGTPDFILAQFLQDSIKAFDEAVAHRAKWRGESTKLPGFAKDILRTDGLTHGCH